MTPEEKLKGIEKLLRKIPQLEEDEGDEDFNPYDRFGGNMDDAYYGGTAQGEADLAAELLSKFFN